MIRMHRRFSSAVTMLMLTALILTGCTSEASNIGKAQDKNGEPDVVDTGFTLSTVGSYDSADTAVVLATDPDNKAVSFINMDTGKQYTLYYDGTTNVTDKYDGPMTISQIKAGDVVDITFLKGRKKLAGIKRSPEAWVYDEVRNYDLAGTNRSASIGSQMYSLPESVVVLSEGRRVEAGEVVSQDVVTISGISHKIYSVNVDRGHGYLRLKNDQPLLGGWIEVGNSVIRQITEDMLLTVPEGSYQVVLTNNNVGCVKEITVERGKEVVLDVGDLEVAEDAVGKILFTVEPEGALVSVDGRLVDISKPVELEYGIHQIQAEASGYDTLTKHIQVGSEYATISFKLEESRKNDAKDSVSDNSIPDRIPWKDTMDSVKENNPKKDSISENELSVSENALGTSNQYKVYVDSPKGVEVYLDGNYVGLSPVRFTKTAGRHEITLKKSGYKTKTYTIYLENTRKDETYSFSALEKENSGNNGGNNGDKDNPSGGSTGTPPLQEVEVNPAAVTVEKGQEVAFEARVNLNGEDQSDVSVTWGLDGQKSEGTKFKGGDEPSTLIVASDESAESLTVTATYMDSETGQTLSGQATVTVKKEEEKNITVEVTADPAEITGNGTITFTAVVKEGDEEKKDAAVKWTSEWTLSEPANNTVKTEGTTMTLSVDSVETDTKFTATATIDGNAEKSASKTVKIKNSDEQEQTNPGGEESKKDLDKGEGVEGDNAGSGIQTGAGNIDTEESDGAGEEDTESGLTTEKVEITKEAHPIKKWFSSLFKK